MKQTFILFAMLMIAISLPAQNLIEKYKQGTVKLIPDAEYANGNNWDKVFETFNDTLYGRHMGFRKNIRLMPDGSAVVDHPYRNFYTKFSPDGKFEKEFNIVNSNGEPFKKIQQISGIINNNTFFTGLDNMGNMTFFDFDGNYVKTLKLDYMSKGEIALPNNKIAVVGWVLWTEKIREFVALVDFDTNEQKIIWEHFTDRSCEPGTECNLFNYSYHFKEQGAISFNTMPYSKSTGMSASPIIANSGDNLIVVIPSTGEIIKYDLEGNKIGKSKVPWNNNYISVDEQKKIQRQAIAKYKSLKNPIFADWVSPEENQLALKSIIQDMENDLDKITDPIPIPAISTIIKDSDENLLFFEYPKKENTNTFNVWVMKNGGEFICQSSFVSDEYNLQINPSKMVFRDGMIYSLQTLNNAKGVPLRLVRFKLE
ncbi:MAG: hypothetical protein JXR50_02475 [Prolixibacteraceae bacterium]|nr:hypothetical protein [Prolixibacteraceae bacterium]MBN2648585.1 hypothetical protein [Prolixibacteraceae bacterium]